MPPAWQRIIDIAGPTYPGAEGPPPRIYVKVWSTASRRPAGVRLRAWAADPPWTPKAVRTPPYRRLGSVGNLLLAADRGDARVQTLGEAYRPAADACAPGPGSLSPLERPCRSTGEVVEAGAQTWP